ncbi:17149_t:CDS:2 [Rhizophagus irregularis]|nr:17149_t:CDS:2 [Rhizophagus irregularis]
MSSIMTPPSTIMGLIRSTTPFGTSADTFSGISGGNLGGSLGENFGGSEWIDTLGGSSAQLFVENNLNGSRGYGPVDYLVTLQCWLTKPR